MNDSTHNPGAVSSNDPQTGDNAPAPPVLVGEIVAAFGVRGQVKMRALIDKPAHLAKLPFVTLQFPAVPGAPARPDRRLRITSARPHKQAFLVSFDGVTTMNESETLREALIFIRPDELPPLGEDEYYASQLVGLQVVTETGRDLGKIEEVLFNPAANDVYETAIAMIPAVASVVVSVSVAEGRMVVRDIPGLRKDE